jgi:hypothetical protein
MEKTKAVILPRPVVLLTGEMVAALDAKVPGCGEKLKKVEAFAAVIAFGHDKTVLTFPGVRQEDLGDGFGRALDGEAMLVVERYGWDDVLKGLGLA